MIGEDELVDPARRLPAVDGVVGVALGGNRARGTHTAAPDVDLGVHHRPPLDVDGLGAVARDIAGADAVVTDPGAWGPRGRAVAAAGLLGDAPPVFAERAHAILGDLGTTGDRSTRALDHAAGLVAEVPRRM